MAGKKSTGKHYVSKGQRPSVKASTVKGVRNSRNRVDKLMNIVSAYEKGGNPWIVVPNPNVNETKKRFIRIRTNDLFCGTSYKDNVYKMVN